MAKQTLYNRRDEGCRQRSIDIDQGSKPIAFFFFFLETQAGSTRIS